MLTCWQHGHHTWPGHCYYRTLQTAGHDADPTNSQIIKSNKHVLNQTTSPQSFINIAYPSPRVLCYMWSMIIYKIGGSAKAVQCPSVSCVPHGFYCHGSCPAVSSVHTVSRVQGVTGLAAALWWWTGPSLVPPRPIIGDIHTLLQHFSSSSDDGWGLTVALLQPPPHFHILSLDQKPSY